MSCHGDDCPDIDDGRRASAPTDEQA